MVNDPINMGTYNYGDPNASGLAVLKHVYYDVKPYTTEWFPVVGLGLGWFNIPDGPTIDCAAKNYNGTNHEASATAPGERTTRENLFSSEGGTVLLKKWLFGAYLC